MLMTPDPLNRWGDRRLPGGGLRGKARVREYERNLEKAANQTAPVAQPNRYDVMRAPEYRPPAATGAEDFKHIASLGVRC